MIEILTTGGTIEKQYDPLTGFMGFKGEHIHTLLQQARIGIEYRVEPILMKDSLDINDKERLLIANKCRLMSNKVIITHGTDSMVETAKVVFEHQASLDQVVVLTGAMVPASVKGSDALFNLGLAISSVQILPPGVYIAMSGQLFNWDEVRKDVDAGRFE
mgnify:CR=1 FL=1